MVPLHIAKQRELNIFLEMVVETNVRLIVITFAVTLHVRDVTSFDNGAILQLNIIQAVGNATS